MRSFGMTTLALALAALASMTGCVAEQAGANDEEALSEAASAVEMGASQLCNACPQEAAPPPPQQPYAGEQPPPSQQPSGGEVTGGEVPIGGVPGGGLPIGGLPIGGLPIGGLPLAVPCCGPTCINPCLAIFRPRPCPIFRPCLF